MPNNNQDMPDMENIRQVNERIASGGVVKGFFVTVKKGQTLVATNIFTGQIITKSNGLKVMWPWLKNKRLSSNHSQSLFRPATTTLTADNISINYDTDYAFKIVDQALFEERSAATRESTAMNEELIKTIGRILDQTVKDHLRQMNSDIFYQTTSLSLENLLNTPQPNGITIAEYFSENYGIQITKMFIKDIALPRSITEAAENARAATARRDMEIRDAEARATVTTTTAEAEATKTRLLAEAQAEQIRQMLNSGLSEQAMATILANEALTNGTNPHTVVLAAAQAQGQNLGGNNPSFDMATMLLLFQQMMNQNNTAPQQNVAVDNMTTPQQNISQAPESETIDWSTLSDDEYLSQEDSLALATERGQRLLENARIHISFLNAEEKTRYRVASERGHNR